MHRSCAHAQVALLLHPAIYIYVVAVGAFGNAGCMHVNVVADNLQESPPLARHIKASYCNACIQF